jgi:hypothetical protein
MSLKREALCLGEHRSASLQLEVVTNEAAGGLVEGAYACASFHISMAGHPQCDKPLSRVKTTKKISLPAW